MSRLPDAGTLDALVIAADDEADRQAWEGLVVQPGGAEAWRAAVARRRRLDTIAGAVRGRAWLARAIRQVAELSRHTHAAPGPRLSLEFPDAQLHALAGAVLGPADDSTSAEVVRPAWGQVVAVPLRVGEHVVLRVSEGAVAVDVRYLCKGHDGPLPTRTWKLEPDEAPVLLLALLGAQVGSPLREALEQAAGIAGVLLVEAAANGETPG